MTKFDNFCQLAPEYRRFASFQREPVYAPLTRFTSLYAFPRKIREFDKMS